MESSGDHYTAGVGSIIKRIIRDTVARFIKQDHPADQSKSRCDLSNGGGVPASGFVSVVYWFCFLGLIK